MWTKPNKNIPCFVKDDGQISFDTEHSSRRDILPEPPAALTGRAAESPRGCLEDTVLPLKPQLEDRVLNTGNSPFHINDIAFQQCIPYNPNIPVGSKPIA